MKKDGKKFESAVAAIQEAFKDITQGKVFQNVKLRDVSGFLREIDVLIKLPTQGTEINIAIECKDHSRKISITQIDGFQSKCADIPLIDKKIFISRNGFSKSARAKAERSSILLLVLEEVTSKSIKKWLQGVSVAGKVNIIRSISYLSVEFTNTPIDILGESILIEFGGEKILLKQFLTSFVNENFVQIPFTVRTEEVPKNRIITRRVRIDFVEPCLIFCDEKSSKIKTLWFNIEDKIVELESKISYDKLSSGGELGTEAEALTITSEDGEVISLVKKSNSEVIDMVISQVDNSGEKKFTKIGEMSITKDSYK